MQYSYVYSLNCIFISQYTNEVNLLQRVKLKWEPKGTRAPFASPWSPRYNDKNYTSGGFKIPALFGVEATASAISCVRSQGRGWEVSTPHLFDHYGDTGTDAVVFRWSKTQ